MGRAAPDQLPERAGWAVSLKRALGGPLLLTDRLRLWVLGVSILAAGCLAGFGFDARGSRRPVLFDRRADAFLLRPSGLDHRVAVVLSEVGDPKVFVVITVVITVALALLGDYRAAAATVAGVALALVLVEELLKPFFDRHLGGLPGPTFPSGHTTVSVALAATLVLAARDVRPLGRLLGPVLARLLGALAVVVACAIGLAMVVLRLHYMTDVVAGVPLGLAVAGATAASVDTVARRWASPGRPL